jgi:hypothetical protein
LDEVEVDDVEFELAGLVLGEVEDVVDDVEQSLSGEVDAVDVLLLALVQPGVLQQTGEADDAVHRGADLVAHRRQERRLGTGGIHGRVPARPRLAAGSALRGQQAGTA